MNIQNEMLLLKFILLTFLKIKGVHELPIKSKDRIRPDVLHNWTSGSSIGQSLVSVSPCFKWPSSGLISAFNVHKHY